MECCSLAKKILRRMKLYEYFLKSKSFESL
jgi:hypothetical protein